MARMIPSRVSETTKSHAERQMFEKISTELSDDWIVLHSLGVAECRDRPWTEVDFVLIGPLGVYCLEVKGGNLQRVGGKWYQNEHELDRGPFEQVVPSATQLHQFLSPRLITSIERRLIVGYGVVTPDVYFNVSGTDIVKKLVYDAEDTSSPFSNYLDRLSRYWLDYYSWRGLSQDPFTGPESKAILNEVRADFDLRPTMPMTMERIQREMLALTNEQYEMLDYFALNDNPRILVNGGAGSGKSMCAVDIAQTQATEGKRVLLLCYNRRLGRHLREVMEPLPGVDAAVFHDYMESLISRAGFTELLGQPPESAEDTRQYYDVWFPEVCVNGLLKLEDLEPYDTLVVDEGQDLVKSGFVDVWDLVLAGGIRDGSWAVFYDENQNIYEGLTDAAMDGLTRARPAQLLLKINCRNTRAIATATSVLSGLEPAPVLKLEGPEVEVIWYRDHAHQKREISRVIRRWLNDGVKPADLAVISCRTLRNSGLAEGLEETVPYQLIEWDKGEPPAEDIIPFSTVHSFKGLESDLVVMADI